MHFFALFRAHELYNVEPFTGLLQDPILDLGCGDGKIAQLLFKRQLAYGIDVSHRAVSRARKLGAYETTFLGDAHHISLEGNSLGGIYSNCVLEHIPDMPNLIQEIARLLKPGAYFVGTAMTPHYYDMNPIFKKLNRDGLRWVRQRMINAENRVHHHVSMFGPDDYRRMFQDVGMTLEQHLYFAPQQVVNFYAWWDTLSKYWFPLQGRLFRYGLLMIYLQMRYRLENRATRVEKWYAQLHSLCFIDAKPDEIGAAQILIARKQ